MLFQHIQIGHYVSDRMYHWLQTGCMTGYIIRKLISENKEEDRKRYREEMKGRRTRERLRQAKKKPLNDGMAVSDKVIENERRRKTGRERPPPFYLCCHLVLAIHFPLLPFSLTHPSSVTHFISTLLLPNALPLNSARIIIIPCFLLLLHLFTL